MARSHLIEYRKKERIQFHFSHIIHSPWCHRLWTATRTTIRRLTIQQQPYSFVVVHSHMTWHNNVRMWCVLCVCCRACTQNLHYNKKKDLLFFIHKNWIRQQRQRQTFFLFCKKKNPKKYYALNLYCLLWARARICSISILFLIFTFCQQIRATRLDCVGLLFILTYLSLLHVQKNAAKFYLFPKSDRNPLYVSSCCCRRRDTSWNMLNSIPAIYTFRYHSKVGRPKKQKMRIIVVRRIDLIAIKIRICARCFTYIRTIFHPFVWNES